MTDQATLQPAAGDAADALRADPPDVAAALSAAREREAIRVINQRIFDTSLDLILVVDRHGTLIRVSPSSFAIVGYRPEEMTGRNAKEFLYPDDLESTRNEMRRARRGRETRNFECRYVHEDGRVVPLMWTGVWSEPEEQHFFIGRDMTERIKLEQQLRQAQKMEAIGQLTGGIAHDFNNILTVITSTIEFLADAVADNPPLAEIASAIDEAAERGAQLTQRMLAFARKQPLQARPVDLNDVVTRAAVMLRRTLGEDISIKTVLAHNLCPALADASQLEDAILNLAVNSRHAMPKGGRLMFETANVRLDEHYAAGNDEVVAGDYVAVTVSDTGCGMPADVIARAFEPFFTTKGVGIGTGLGLSMVYGFAKQSRGHVKIYSEVGYGTGITIYLPRADVAATTKTERAPDAEPYATAHETILVVEDDASVRTVAVGTLGRLGYQVLEAQDARTALDILDGPAAIDLLFTDLIMPNGMGGQELLLQARKRRPGLKALFTSGYSESFIKERGDAVQGVSLLSKPYRAQTLASVIRGALEGT